MFQRPPRPAKGDFVAGITNGIASIPDGMSSGVIAGINPVYGLYSLMVSTPIAALTVSTQLMVVNTTSAMILVASDGLGTLQGDDRVQAMIGISLVAGLFQLILGVLGLGTLTKFVSNAVMTGLLTGVAVLIVLGQLWDFFGYTGSGETKIQKTLDLLRHPREIDPWTTGVGLAAIGLMVILQQSRLAKVNLLAGLAVATILAAVLDRDSVALVSSMGDIPRELPAFHVPHITRLSR
jgi:SulP family sulfate permease